MAKRRSNQLAQQLSPSDYSKLQHGQIVESRAEAWEDVRETLNSARGNTKRERARLAKEVHAGKVAKMGLLKITEIQAACTQEALITPYFNVVKADSSAQENNEFLKGYLTFAVGWEELRTDPSLVRLRKIDWEGISLQMLVHESMFQWPLKVDLWGIGPVNKGHLIGTGEMNCDAFVGRPKEWVTARVPVQRYNVGKGEIFFKVHFTWIEDIGKWGSTLHEDKVQRTAGTLTSMDPPTTHMISFWGFQVVELPLELVQEATGAFIRLRLGWSETCTILQKFRPSQQVWRWPDSPSIELPYDETMASHLVEFELWQEYQNHDDKLLGVGVIKLKKLLSFPHGDDIRFELSLKRGTEFRGILEFYAKAKDPDSLDESADHHTVVSEGVAERRSNRNLIKAKTVDQADGMAQTTVSLSAIGRLRDLRQQEEAVGKIVVSKLFILGLPSLDLEEQRGFQSLDPYVLMRLAQKNPQKTEIKVNSGQDCAWETQIVLPATRAALSSHLSIEVWCDRDPLPDRLISCGRVDVSDALQAEDGEMEMRLFTPQGKWGGMLRFVTKFEDKLGSSEGLEGVQTEDYRKLLSSQKANDVRSSGQLPFTSPLRKGVTFTPNKTASSDDAEECLIDTLRMLQLGPSSAPTPGHHRWVGNGFAKPSASDGQYQFLALVSLARLALSSAKQLASMRDAVDINQLMMGLRHKELNIRKASALLILLLASGSPEFQEVMSQHEPGFSFRGSWIFGLPKMLFHHFELMRKAAHDIYDVETLEGEVLSVGYKRLEPKNGVTSDSKPFSYAIGAEVYVLPNTQHQSTKISKRKINKRYARVVGIETRKEVQFPAEEFYDNLRNMLTNQAEEGLGRAAAAAPGIATIQFVCWPPVYLGQDIFQPAENPQGIEDATILLVNQIPDPELSLLGFDLTPGVHEGGRELGASVSLGTSYPWKKEHKPAKPVHTANQGPPETKIQAFVCELAESLGVKGPIESAEVPVQDIIEEPLFYEIWGAEDLASFMSSMRGRTSVNLKELISHNDFVTKKSTANNSKVWTRPHNAVNFGAITPKELGPTVIYQEKARLSAWKTTTEGSKLEAVMEEEFGPREMFVTFRVDLLSDEVIISAQDPSSPRQQSWTFYAHIGRKELEAFLGRSFEGNPGALLQLSPQEMTMITDALVLPQPGEINPGCSPAYSDSKSSLNRLPAVQDGKILLRLMGEDTNNQISFEAADDTAAKLCSPTRTNPIFKAHKTMFYVVDVLIGALDEVEVQEKEENDNASSSAKSKKKKKFTHLVHAHLERLHELAMKCINAFNLFIQDRIRERLEGSWWAAPDKQAFLESQKELEYVKTHLHSVKSLHLGHRFRDLEPRTPPGETRGWASTVKIKQQPPNFDASTGKVAHPPSRNQEDAGILSPNATRRRATKHRMDKIESTCQSCRNALTEALKQSKLMAYKRQPRKGYLLVAQEMEQVLKTISAMLPGDKDRSRSVSMGSNPEAFDLEEENPQTQRSASPRASTDSPHQPALELPKARKPAVNYKVVLGDSIGQDRAEFVAPEMSPVSSLRSNAGSRIHEKNPVHLKTNRKLAKHSFKNIKERELYEREELRKRIQAKMDRVDKMNEGRRNSNLSQKASPPRKRPGATATERERWAAAIRNQPNIR